MTLKTVKVPADVAPLFERAEQVVGSYSAAMQRSAEAGSIEIFDSRYVLLRGASLSIEFFLLVCRIYGAEAEQDADLFASALLYDLAHAIGRSDAQNFHGKMDLVDPIEKLSAGPVHFSRSGITLFPDNGEDASALLRHADLAMYHAKNSGRNNFQYFSSDMNQRVQERLVLERELRKALDSEQIDVNYQPRYCTEDDSIKGMEALVRWHHPERGPISPAAFIPVAEETGLIVQIGTIVLRKSCLQFRQWLDQGLEPGLLSVNLSPRQFRQPDLVPMVRQILESSGFPATSLELEITEGAVMDDTENAIAIMRELKSLGIRLAIDDFGTGYSSLSYLQLFPVDTLKIDRSFIDAAQEADRPPAQLLGSIIQLAHSLGLGVVAEGIETAEQYELVRDLGSEEAQGYHLCRPQAADTIPELLNIEQG